MGASGSPAWVTRGSVRELIPRAAIELSARHSLVEALRSRQEGRVAARAHDLYYLYEVDRQLGY